MVLAMTLGARNPVTSVTERNLGSPGGRGAMATHADAEALDAVKNVYRAPCGGGRGKEEPLGVIAMVLQAAPGNDGLPPPGPPRHTSAA